MAELLIRTLPDSFVDSEDAWVPVPLHWLRHGDRAFNQSHLLARSLVKHTGGSVCPLLRRTRNTPAQSGQGYRLRAENVRGAFSVRRRQKLPRSVLLIDDVVTTGATVSECARVLKEAGIDRVRVLAFARTE
ncbi:MAG: ComF family protein [bacterium]|nr:ComF family protein [bacterium]